MRGGMPRLYIESRKGMSMSTKKEETKGGEFGQPITGVWSKGDQRKEFSGDPSGCTITGQYMEIKVDRIFENFMLKSQDTGEPKPFTLFHVMFRNLHRFVIKTQSSGSVIMIDTDGNQYENEVGLQWEYGNVPLDKTEELSNDAFPEPDLQLHAGTKTQGWLYFRRTPKGLHPKKLILRIDVFDPGEVSGWVRDSETFEFMFGSPNESI